MFDHITGHQQNKAFLERFLNREERPHALLFYGPEGIGKCLLAKEFARAFLCHGTGEERPCGHCESCRLLNFATGNFAHPDYLYFDPATDEEQEKKKTKIITVSQIRSLIRQASFGPTLSGHKICIINEADTMNQEAANSLLKLLEEPPDKWFFILIATSVSRLLPTILSRVIQVRFVPLTVEETKQALLDKEVPEAEADLLAHLSDGSLGQALRFRDERILDFRNMALKYVAEFPLQAPMTYLLEEDYFSDMIPASGGNERLQQFLSMTVSLLRDLLFVKNGLPDRVFNIDALPQLQQIAGKWEARRLYQATGAAQEAVAAAVRRANAKSVLDNVTFTINACYEGKI
ncbi:MAG: DNA polymerase III subunit delta' [Acidaminococcaceae bacterium]|nr:DNA polymerase III subunit delta' [Acidaminococcaceae bacterium]